MNNLHATKDLLGKAQVVILIDSTVKPAALKDWLLMDISMLVMLMSTLEHMEQYIMAMYYNGEGSNVTTSQRMTPPDSFLVCNLFDHLACKGIYRTIANPEDPQQLDRFAMQLKDFVRTMEQIRDNIFEKIGSYVAFVTLSLIHI